MSKNSINFFFKNKLHGFAAGVYWIGAVSAELWAIKIGLTLAWFRTGKSWMFFMFTARELTANRLANVGVEFVHENIHFSEPPGFL
jgi:hypothetical protein